MEFVLNRQPDRNVQVSFILLDWSCRESLHILDYLSQQSVPRDQYEIIWIEYYQRRSEDLIRRIVAAEAAGRHPPVDVYCIMGMPTTAYYHKHLMYNLGILLAHGRILCICDSDAFMSRNLVSVIQKEFDAHSNIVLHLDEVRNNDHRYYPFNYSDCDEVTGLGCGTWIDGKPHGLSDPIDPLHSRNYGACMCALRDDLVAIGGADLHVDYLGHICGPYELTFRLINAGKREVWHDKEWLYHVWHPGQAGEGNYLGPHDGEHMSTTALAVRSTGRIQPLVPHPAIIRFRDNANRPATDDLVRDFINPAWLTEWDIRQFDANHAPVLPGAEQSRASANHKKPARPQLGWFDQVRLMPAIAGLLWRQLRIKRRASRLRPAPITKLATAREPARKVGAFWSFIKRMLAYDRHLFRLCWHHLGYVMSLGQSEVVLYGDGEAATILSNLSRFLPVRIRAICPFDRSSPMHDNQEVWSEQQLTAYQGMVIVSAFVNSAAHARRLEELGIERKRFIVLE